jgi:hypothetical protein
LLLSRVDDVHGLKRRRAWRIRGSRSCDWRFEISRRISPFNSAVLGLSTTTLQYGAHRTSARIRVAHGVFCTCMPEASFTMLTSAIAFAVEGNAHESIGAIH